jgi:hypothetical protein
MMWIIQGIRNGNLLFFSRVNPDIETGGFFSEEKWPIYDMFPKEYIPLCLLIKKGSPHLHLKWAIDDSALSFPMLVKPNIGERGMGIEKILKGSQLYDYHEKAAYDYILQSFVPYKKEMSVLVYRMPDQYRVEVTSICLKEKLTIVGDGKSTLHQLAMSNFRSRNQWPRLRHQFDENRVLIQGEKLLLEPIGNHCRGTTFLNGNHLITEDVRLAMEQLFHSMKGEVYYGRFDILYESIETLIQLKSFSVVEFNGVGSEPAHIYQPGFSLWRAYEDLWKHARILGDISLAQKKRSVTCMTWNDFFRALKVYRENMRHF